MQSRNYGLVIPCASFTVSAIYLQVQENVRQWIADFYSHEDHSEIADAKVLNFSLTLTI